MVSTMSSYRHDCRKDENDPDNDVRLTQQLRATLQEWMLIVPPRFACGHPTYWWGADKRSEEGTLGHDYCYQNKNIPNGRYALGC